MPPATSTIGLSLMQEGCVKSIANGVPSCSSLQLAWRVTRRSVCTPPGARGDRLRSMKHWRCIRQLTSISTRKKRATIGRTFGGCFYTLRFTQPADPLLATNLILPLSFFSRTVIKDDLIFAEHATGERTRYFRASSAPLLKVQQRRGKHTRLVVQEPPDVGHGGDAI